MGGEQTNPAALTTPNVGSSPHGRGTVHGCLVDAAPFRFIPAWAGNRPFKAAEFWQDAVHPRMGGEQALKLGLSISVPGSSPHGRGTVAAGPAGGGSRRFIPAWAGNRLSSPAGEVGSSVHPRMGGEQALLALISRTADGSSPHGRGTVMEAKGSFIRHRFIPAWAGNSMPSHRHGFAGPVHPRMGGEQLLVRRFPPRQNGSSPHGRGTEI